MRTLTMADGSRFDPARAGAAELVWGDRASVRMIRIGPFRSLPAHTHGESDLMLYGAEG